MCACTCRVALQSHQRAVKAMAAGFFDDLVVAIEGTVRDAIPRADTSGEKLATLKPAFDRTSGEGTITAGNASPLTDGAAAIWVASDAGLARLPASRARVRLVDYELAAVDVFKEGLLMAPAYAIPRLLARHGLALDAVDLWEIHEAFAAQVLCNVTAIESAEFVRDKAGVAASLGRFPWDRMNPNGGSIAIGHPFGATGARILSQTVKELAAMGPGKRAIVSICADGGLGTVALLQSGSRSARLPRVPAEAIARRRDPAHEAILVVHAGRGFILGRAHRDHQRHEVILLGVGEARGGCARPIHEALRAFRGLGSQRFVEPGIECLRGRPGGRAHHPQVMPRQAAAHDQHALLAQGPQRAPDRQVLGRIVAALQRDLHHRHVGTRVHRREGREGAVVVAALGIERRGNAGRLEQLLHALGHFRRARRTVLDRIGVLREAGVVVDHPRPLARLHRGAIGFPVSRNHEHGPGLADLAGDVGERLLEPVELAPEGTIEPRPRPAAVRDEVGGKPHRLTPLAVGDGPRACGRSRCRGPTLRLRPRTGTGTGTTRRSRARPGSASAAARCLW